LNFNQIIFLKDEVNIRWYDLMCLWVNTNVYICLFSKWYER
jgi:hypothetical protein